MRLLDAAQIAGQRTDVHRRRVRFAERIVVPVEQTRAEVLALADDRGIGHAVEHVAHLLGDRVQRAADDLQCDRVDFCGGVGHDCPLQMEPRATRMSPCDSTAAT